MTLIVGTGNIIERTLSPIYTEAELRELEEIEDNDLFDLVIVYGGMECYDEAVKEIFGHCVQDQINDVMKKIKK